MRPYLEIWSKRWGVPFEGLWQLGSDPDDPDKFNMAAMCLRVAGAANGVSALHGEVSRGLFAGVGIGDEIASVTNGVHARTWTARHMQDVFDDLLGSGWADGDPESWGRAVEIDKATLETARRQSSLALVDMVRARAGGDVDPDALIVGFARRFAPYKRATLLMRHRDRLQALLDEDQRPIHFLFAGKAHPADDLGKQLVSDVLSFAASAEARGRITFIPDYDIDIAAGLIQGCDIWLNNPIRPREASGTSGEKAALNGGLNCSILDGWWAEMFDGENGWAIPMSHEEDPERRDDEEASAMLDVLVKVRDEYHDARTMFNGRIRHAWMTLGPRVVATRMLREYDERFYRPALERTG
jgi:starch phosphorylase